MECIFCKSESHSLFININSMMVDGDKSTNYHFLKCYDCESVFLESPLDEQELGDYYPSYYLPYRGETAWDKYSTFVHWQDSSINLKRVNLVSDYLSF